MQIQFYRGAQPNFGDELNLWMWPRLLPGFFDDDPSVLFIGIGSILGAPYAADARKIVFGTGYVRSYHQKPDLSDESWDIFFLRGRRTALALGLPETLAIGDSATLLRSLDHPFERAPRHIGFIPHWESLPRGNWQETCELAGIRLIDPTAPVEDVINEILQCKVLICEAMHGAIIADTLRVPWIPVVPIAHEHRDKWVDWSDTLEIKLERRRIWPSNLAELKATTAYRRYLSKVAALSATRPLSWITEPLITHLAAKRLSLIAQRTPFLSTDTVVERLTSRMLEKLHLLEKRYSRVP